MIKIRHRRGQAEFQLSSQVKGQRWAKKIHNDFSSLFVMPAFILETNYKGNNKK